jgi:hypothetical protein
LGTYTSGDQITPTGTLNSLTVNDNLPTQLTGSLNGEGVWYPTSLPGTTVSNVQTVTFNSTETITADTLNSTLGFSGLKQLNINSLSAGYVSDHITAASTTAVTVNDALTSAYFVDNSLGYPNDNATVTGGSKVVFNENNGTFLANSGQTIFINGGSGTTDVTVNQTQTKAAPFSQRVVITDVNSSNSTYGIGPVSAIGKAGTLANISLSGLKSTNAQLNSDVLTNLSITNSSYAGVLIDNQLKNTNSATTLNLAVSGDKTLTLTDNHQVYKVLNVGTGNTGSNVIFNNFTQVTTENISGSSVLTQTSGALGINLTAINISGNAGFISLTDLDNYSKLASITSTSTGLIGVAINAQKTSFTGGAGQDVVIINKDATKSISAGSASNNEIVLNAGSSSFTQAVTGANVQGFTTLGVSSNSFGTFALSGAAALFSGITAADVLSPTAGAITFTNAEADTSLSFEDVGGGNYTQAVKFITTGINDGANESLTINLGISAAAAAAVGSSAVIPTDMGFSVNNLTVSDSTNQGIANLIINSYTNDPSNFNGPLSVYANTIGTLNDAGLTSLTLNGTGGFRVLNNFALNNSTSALTLTDNSTNHYSGITFANSLLGANLSTLNLDGTNTNTIFDGITIQSLFLGTTSFTVNDTSAGNATIASLASTAHLSTLDFENSGSGLLSINTVYDTYLTSLTLTGDVSYASASLYDPSTVYNSVSLSNQVVAGWHNWAASNAPTWAFGSSGAVNSWGYDNVTSAITVSGATDNADVTFWTGLNHNTSGVDNITLGDGNNNVADTSLGHVNITLGSGSNDVWAYGFIGAVSSNTNPLYESGFDTITFGAHDVSQQDIVGVGFLDPSTGFDAFGLPTNYSIITGLNSSPTGQDQIWFAGDYQAGLNHGTVNVVGAGQVSNVNGGTSNIANWFAAATANSLVNIHQVESFVFGNATYLVESTNAGGNHTTVVELVGVNVTSASTVYKIKNNKKQKNKQEKIKKKKK